MSITIADFNSLVSDELNKGTSMDSVIPTKVAQAVRFIERKNDFNYMQGFDDSVTLTTGTRTLALPAGVLIKSIKMFRLVSDAGYYTNLFAVHPGDLSATSSAKPEGYWHRSFSELVFDNIPDEDYSYEMLYMQYTDWRAADTGTTPWLLEYAEDLLLAQTMIYFAPYLRDPKLIQVWGDIYKQSLESVLAADEQFDYQNTDMRMEFS